VAIESGQAHRPRRRESVCLALQQAERYGTPLGQSLRVMAQENRDMRMNEAEKKAAALPPKLTVPMILFFCRSCLSSFSDRPASRLPRCSDGDADIEGAAGRAPQI